MKLILLCFILILNVYGNDNDLDTSLHMTQTLAHSHEASFSQAGEAGLETPQAKAMLRQEKPQVYHKIFDSTTADVGRKAPTKRPTPRPPTKKPTVPPATTSPPVFPTPFPTAFPTNFPTKFPTDFTAPDTTFTSSPTGVPTPQGNTQTPIPQAPTLQGPTSSPISIILTPTSSPSLQTVIGAGTDSNERNGADNKMKLSWALIILGTWFSFIFS